MTAPSLGIYGPGPTDKSGVSKYIAESLEHLGAYFRVQWIGSGDDDWVSPDRFDYTLYNIGNNEFHRSALRAAMLRSSVSLLHEYLHLDLYFKVWDDLSEARRREILVALARASGVSARSAREFVERAEARSVDAYSIDIGIEGYVLQASKLALVHSDDLARKLRVRHPSCQVAAVPFPVTAWRDYDRSIPRKFGITTESYVFGAFGFIGEYKRIPAILEAWRNWRERPSEILLLLAGARQFSVDSDIEGVIETGWLEAEAFDALIQRADCGVQLRKPSLGETSGPAAAFCAHKRPIILSDTPEMRAIGRGENVAFLKADAGSDELLALMKARYEARSNSEITYDESFAWRAWAAKVHSHLIGAAVQT